jgi:Flp pilus assembly protein TadB
MTWNVGSSQGAKRDRRMRRTVTWGTEGRRQRRNEERQLRRQRGFGSWGTQNRRLDRERRRSERRASRGAKRRSSFVAMITAALLFGAALLISPASRATGVLILFVTLVVYVVTRRKRA